jgi:hypothetical protein
VLAPDDDDSGCCELVECTVSRSLCDVEPTILSVLVAREVGCPEITSSTVEEDRGVCVSDVNAASDVFESVVLSPCLVVG